MLRLAEHMKYNREHVDSREKIDGEIKKIEEMAPKSKEENSEKLRKLKAERDIIDMNTPRNMIGGLLQKECVCAGYAEIVRNTLACCGIEAIYVDGQTEKEGESGHAWNQVKLDGQWYNMDLTWARDDLVNGKIPRHLLMSDKDFASGEHRYKGRIFQNPGHDRYLRDRGIEQECLETFPLEELEKLIVHPPTQSITYKEWINQAHKHINRTQVRDAERTVQGDTRSRERSQEHDKEQRDR